MIGYKTEKVLQKCYRFLYSSALVILLPLLLLLFKKKLKMDAHYDGKPRRFSERFGKVCEGMKGQGIVVHCVSIGELNASVNLVKRLQREYPKLVITITTTSTTGAQHAFNLYKDSVQHLFLPIDIPFFMERFFNALKPKLVLVTEVEIWPNMLRQCVKRKIPVALINARLSSDSLATYQKLSFLLRPALRQFDLICAQSQESYNNFKALGVYKHQLKLTRNMKFDMQADPADEQKATQLKQLYAFGKSPVWVAASTHDSEELFVLSVYQQLLKTDKSLKLIIVPRHPHRFEQVYLAIKATGLSVTQLSDSLSSQEESSDKNAQSSSQVILVDQMGWLKACYSLCNIAFIGGSIAPKGGHNALECAMYGKAMVMGPSTFNNPVIVEMLEEGSALEIIQNEKECERLLTQMLLDSKLADKRGAAGKSVLEKNRGALDLTYQEVITLL
jgi:3-deoxy-D-manno-octulosonic-acid transferase